MNSVPFETRLESVLCGMERNGYAVEARIQNGEPRRVMTSLPESPLPWDMDAPLMEQWRSLWGEDRARFLAHLINTGKKQGA